MSLTRSVSAKWLAHLLTMAVGFFLMPYVMKTMGESGYGAWVFVNSIAGYSNLLYLGFGATVCRFVADCRGREDWNRLNAVASGVFSVYLAAATGVMAISAGLAATAHHLGDWGDVPLADVRIAMLLLGLNIAIGMLGSVYGGVLIAAQRFDLHGVIESVTALARLLLTVLFLRREHALITLGLIFVGITLIENAITVILAKREIRTLSIRPRHIDRVALRECFSFSMYTALSGMAVQLIHLTDVVIIGLFLGKDAAVPYYIALRLVQMVQGPLSKIGDVVLPKAGDLHAQGDARGVAALCGRAMGLSVLLSTAFLLGCIDFGGLFIQTWMGPGQTDSHRVLIILAAAQVVGQPLLVLRQTLMALGDVRRPAWFDLIQAFLNLGLSVALIPSMGIVGVAWGTLLPLLVMDLCFLLPYGLKRLGISGRELLSLAVVPQLVPLALLLAYCETFRALDPRPNWSWMIAVASGALVLLAGTWMVRLRGKSLLLARSA